MLCIAALNITSCFSMDFLPFDQLHTDDIAPTFLANSSPKYCNTESLINENDTPCTLSSSIGNDKLSNQPFYFAYEDFIGDNNEKELSKDNTISAADLFFIQKRNKEEQPAGDWVELLIQSSYNPLTNVHTPIINPENNRPLNLSETFINTLDCFKMAQEFLYDRLKDAIIRNDIETFNQFYNFKQIKINATTEYDIQYTKELFIAAAKSKNPYFIKKLAHANERVSISAFEYRTVLLAASKVIPVFNAALNHYTGLVLSEAEQYNAELEKLNWKIKIMLN